MREGGLEQPIQPLQGGEEFRDLGFALHLRLQSEPQEPSSQVATLPLILLKVQVIQRVLNVGFCPSVFLEAKDQELGRSRIEPVP